MTPNPGSISEDLSLSYASPYPDLRSHPLGRCNHPGNRARCVADLGSVSMDDRAKLVLDSIFFIPPSPFYPELLQSPFLKISHIHPSSLYCYCPTAVEAQVVLHLSFYNKHPVAPQPPVLPPSSLCFTMKPLLQIPPGIKPQSWSSQPLQTPDAFFLMCIDCSKDTELLLVLKNYVFFSPCCRNSYYFLCPSCFPVLTLGLANLYFIIQVSA